MVCNSVKLPNVKHSHFSKNKKTEGWMVSAGLRWWERVKVVGKGKGRGERNGNERKGVEPLFATFPQARVCPAS